jgi:hypothetical protein
MPISTLPGAAPGKSPRAPDCSIVITYSGEILFWKGPAPWFFVTVPEKESRDLEAISGMVTYGWGVIPVHVRIGKTEWQTSLFPKDERFS